MVPAQPTRNPARTCTALAPWLLAPLWTLLPLAGCGLTRAVQQKMAVTATVVPDRGTPAGPVVPVAPIGGGRGDFQSASLLR